MVAPKARMKMPTAPTAGQPTFMPSRKSLNLPKLIIYRIAITNNTAAGIAIRFQPIGLTPGVLSPPDQLDSDLISPLTY